MKVKEITQRVTKEKIKVKELYQVEKRVTMDHRKEVRFIFFYMFKTLYYVYMLSDINK